jgi:actin-like ATPase involved in cell morphogenesis
MTYALAIDVGTTFTAAAVWHDGRAEVVPLGNHNNAVPSVLFLRHDGVMLVGDAADRRAVGEPGRVAREFKRRLGDRVPVMLGDRRFTPQQLTGEMIAWVLAKVTERLGRPPGYVILTCPANWGEYRRQRMTEAAEAAGLSGAELLSEPHAAAVYYAAGERLEPGALVAVYDFGGGTFDAAVLRKTEHGFELCGDPAGEDELGGVDIDQAVIDRVAAAMGTHWSALDSADPAVATAVAQVRASAVQAKEALSADLEAAVPVVLPGLTRQVRVTRAELEEEVRPQVQRTIETLERAIEQASVTPDQLHAVLLVGGASRMPLISELIAAELKVPVSVDAHPKFAVCLGAAIAAAPRVDDGTAATPAPAAAVASTGPEQTLPPGSGAEAPPPVPPRHRPVRWLALALAGLVAAGGVLWGLDAARAWRSSPSRPTAGPTTVVPRPNPTWTELPAALTTFESAGVASFRGRLWVAGGFDERRAALTSVLVYDPGRKSWSEGPPLPEPLTHAALVTTDKDLLLIGGYRNNTTNPISTVRRLDLGTSRWVEEPALPAPLGAGAAAWDGRRVVYAGGVGADRRPSAAVLALQDGTWRRIGTLPRAREHLATASDGRGRVWFLAGEVNTGGPTPRKKVFSEVDLVQGGSVRRVGQVATARGSVAGFWSRSTGPCVAGGRNEAGVLLPQVECLGAGGRSTSLQPLPTARHGLGVAVLDGVAYAVGGGVSGRHSTELGGSLRLPR